MSVITLIWYLNVPFNSIAFSVAVSIDLVKFTVTEVYEDIIPKMYYLFPAPSVLFIGVHSVAD